MNLSFSLMNALVSVIFRLLGLLAWVLRFLPITFFNRRVEFEHRNLTDPWCQSFGHHQLKAHTCFEVSSEGEFEQVVQVMDKMLESSEQLRLEIIYCSPSVEEGIHHYAQKYGIERIRIFRLPLISEGKTQKLSRWITAQQLVFCRYDFFPHLMKLPLPKILLSASLKGKNLNGLGKWWRSQFFLQFKLIGAVSSLDLEKFRSLWSGGAKGLELLTFDARVLRIEERLQQRQKKLEEKIPFYSQLKAFLDEFSEEKKMIWGNFWKEDAALVKECPAGALHLIVPHVVSDESSQLIGEAFENEFIVLTEQTHWDDFVAHYREKPRPIILQMKGVLLELYQEFSFAYVGGGFTYSVHSALEPYMGGCFVCIGPKNQRSAEWEVIQHLSPERCFELEESSDIQEALQKWDASRKTKQDGLEKKLAMENRQALGQVVGFLLKNVETVK